MYAFVVMPNHVHVLTTFRDGFRLCDVVRGWKSYPARRINESLGREGRLWQRDYFDRYIRDETHFERVRAYIEQSPVKAGLVKVATSWRFSSAAADSRSRHALPIKIPTNSTSAPPSITLATADSGGVSM
jgi:putative DNA methylase